ncbi:MAG: triose-phosphate isomerase [Candidatus Nanohaloarchaeota archaeon QJJ-5]|nr:triose-phosphate isomerase [Candidatus Nanohaloarchaeota archaeon QJJ-5]
MNLPTIIVNFKTYEKASGDAARDLAFKCEKSAKETDKEIGIAVQNADIQRISSKVDIPVFAQHVDPVDFGSNTGSDLAHTIAYNGADGVIINHSEDQMPLDDIKTVIKHCHDEGLETLVCVDEPGLARRVAALEPDMIAFEPPELIGGDTSVTDAEPDLIKETLHNIREKRDVPLLVGAGIKDADDVETARDIGTRGVLIASGVIKADDQRSVLEDLASSL